MCEETKGLVSAIRAERDPSKRDALFRQLEVHLADSVARRLHGLARQFRWDGPYGIPPLPAEGAG